MTEDKAVFIIELKDQIIQKIAYYSVYVSKGTLRVHIADKDTEEEAMELIDLLTEAAFEAVHLANLWRKNDERLR